MFEYRLFYSNSITDLVEELNSRARNGWKLSHMGQVGLSHFAVIEKEAEKPAIPAILANKPQEKNGTTKKQTAEK